MRVYGVEKDGKFREYVPTPFEVEHEEAVLEDWLEENPDGILEDGKLLIVGRQTNTNLGSTIDLLALDRVGDVVVVELKRDRTPRDTLAQALEYASFAEQLDANQLEGILQSYMNDDSLSLAEYHKEYFDLTLDEAVSFNKDQRIVIVGQRVTSEVRQTALFLRSKGIRVTCVEFSFFQADGGTKLLSQEIVVGTEPSRPQRVSSGSRPVINHADFIQVLDENGRMVFEKILEFARMHAMPIHWGTRGFSLNIDLDGTHVAVFFCYPPASVYKQSIYTVLADQCGIIGKTAVPDDEVKRLQTMIQETGLFRPGGHELKCLIDRAFDDKEVGKILSWCEEVATAVGEYGLKGQAGRPTF
ncbi:MAG: hypothetical protein ACYC0L_01790 [Thermoleophilia bacterium]